MAATPLRADESALWPRLAALDLDGSDALSFSGRLARDNGWAPGFARRVVLEYKRFVFLAATCGHPVTPSDEVDQAWHLHLVYTRSYWDELCGQVLGFPLHHGPTKGGAAEGGKFADWYAATLASYRAAFGAEPPADIWPPAAVRFGEAPFFRRINVRRYWLLPRSGWSGWGLSLRQRLGRHLSHCRGWGRALGQMLRRVLRRPAAGRWAGAGALLLLFGLALVGCTARTPLNPLDWYGPEFLTLFWVLLVGGLGGAEWARARDRGPAEDYSGPPLNTYALARLADRGQRLADSALAALAHSGHLELLGEQKVRRTDAAPPTDLYERAVWNLVIPTGWSKLAEVREQAALPQIGAVQQLDTELEARDLLLVPSERRRLNGYVLWVGLALGVLGLAKVMVGSMRGRPVGLLVLSLLALAGIVAYCYHAHGAWATGRGARLLRELAAGVRQRRHAAGPPAADTVALTVALFGLSDLNGLGLGELGKRLAPPPSTDGGGGDGGSGCGGGGCGGGGCGGCGS